MFEWWSWSGFLDLVRHRVRSGKSLECGGRQAATGFITLIGLASTSGGGGDAELPAYVQRAVEVLVDSVVLGALAGLGAIAGMGPQTVLDRPLTVAYTFLFAFLLQALRHIAQVRGLQDDADGGGD